MSFGRCSGPNSVNSRVITTWLASSAASTRPNRRVNRVSRGRQRMSAYLAVQQVAFTADGFQQLRLFRVVAQLLAQARYQQVDAAVEGFHGTAPGGVHQLFAAEDALRPFQKRAQQPVFGVGQRHHQLRRGGDLALQVAQAPAGKLYRVLFAGGRAATGAAQDGVDARHQLARVERFYHVVVGTQLQAYHAVGRLATGGQHDDRRIADAAHVTTQRQAVFAGQHQVEDDQVEAGVRQRVAHGLAIADAQALHAVTLQVVRQQGADIGVVVNDQQMDAVFV